MDKVTIKQEQSLLAFLKFFNPHIINKDPFQTQGITVGVLTPDTYHIIIMKIGV